MKTIRTLPAICTTAMLFGSALLLARRLQDRCRRAQQPPPPPPPPDTKLDSLKEEIHAAVRRVNPQLPAPQPDRLPAGTLVAFSSRYTVERELRRLWQRALHEPAPPRPLPQLAGALMSKGILPRPLARTLDIISRVASPAIHGEPISAAKIDFLREVTPAVTAALQALRRQSKDKKS